MTRQRILLSMVAGMSLIVAACQGQCPVKNKGVRIAAAGGGHSCAALWDGTMKCWGENGSGQLGNSTNSSSLLPVDVSGLAFAAPNPSLPRAVAAGENHTCLITSDGKIFCQGSNAQGQLGLDSKIDFNNRQPARALNNANTAKLANLLAAGATHTCAVYDGDIVGCWGRNGQLLPTVVPGVSALHIAAHANRTCVIETTGVIKCWDVQFSPPAPFTPTEVMGFTARTAIAVGRNHACFGDSSGAIWCWGNNAFGQRGDGTHFPASGLSKVTPVSSGKLLDLAAGEFHTCALFDTGGVDCWGGNSVYQTGDPNPGSGMTLTPFQVIASGAYSIAVGDAHSCAVVEESGVRRMVCWGANGNGQLGNGGTNNSAAPVHVSGMP